MSTISYGHKDISEVNIQATVNVLRPEFLTSKVRS